MSRASQVTERVDGAVTSDLSQVWCELKRCEVRHAVTGQVLSRSQEWGEWTAAGGRFHSTDHLGSIRFETDNAGAILAARSFDPWGRLEAEPWSGMVGYSGHTGTGAGELWLTLYRGYDAETGRWLSEDPLGGLSDSWNRYTYSMQNPVGRVDRLGLSSEMAAVQGVRVVCTVDMYRNFLNRCPASEPSNDPEWQKDSAALTALLSFGGGSGSPKYRNRNGSECGYDDCGMLLPDDGSYTFNFAPTKSLVLHILLDVIPAHMCLGKHGGGTTKY